MKTLLSFLLPLLSASCLAAGISNPPGFMAGARVITVAQSGAQFTTVGAAVASIVDTSSRTVILISPATYAETAFTLPANVSLSGNGGTANLYFASGSAPAVTISTESTVHTIQNVFIAQTSFGNVGIKVDGASAAIDTFTNNNVVLVNSTVVGNPAIQVTGGRALTISGGSATGIFGSAIATFGSGPVDVGNAVLSTAGGAFDVVSLGANNTGHRFRSVRFGGTAKAINSAVTVTPSIDGVSFQNSGMNFGTNVIPASTGTFVAQSLYAYASSTTVNGTLSVGGGSITVYYCSGSTAGTFDGNLARNNANAGACAGGTWVATSLKVN